MVSNLYSKCRLIKFILIIPITISLCSYSIYAQGNYVPSSWEAVSNFSIDLSAATPQGWSTMRSAVPGYFSMVSAATYIGASDSANINGYVKYYALGAPAASFTFPVGTGTELRNLTISGTMAATTQIGAAWMAGDPGIVIDPTDGTTHSRVATGPGIVAASTIGTWDFVDLGANAAGLNVTVSIPDLTRFAVPTDLRLVGWNGTAWINLSVSQGSAAASGNTVGSSLTGTIPTGITITAIGMGSIATPLPLEVTAFSARPAGCDALISFTSVLENSVKTYNLERSMDGQSFIRVTYIEPTGNGTYTFRMAQSENTAWYRIQVLNKNGGSMYSSTEKVTTSCGSWVQSLLLFPNPVHAGSEELELRINTFVGGPIRLEITGTDGKVLKQLNTTLEAGAQLIRLDVSNLPAATYYLQLRGQDGGLLFPGQRFVKL